MSRWEVWGVASGWLRVSHMSGCSCCWCSYMYAQFYIRQRVYMIITFINLSISIYPSIYPSIDLSIYTSIYRSIYRSIDLSESTHYVQVSACSRNIGSSLRSSSLIEVQLPQFLSFSAMIIWCEVPPVKPMFGNRHANRWSKSHDSKSIVYL